MQSCGLKDGGKPSAVPSPEPVKTQTSKRFGWESLVASRARGLDTFEHLSNALLILIFNDSLSDD